MNAQRIEDLVTAYKILLNEDVLDSFGHVSVRSATDPAASSCLMRCRRRWSGRGRHRVHVADSQPIDPAGRKVNGERYIHGEIYKARPDVQAVIHSHSQAVIPFSVAGVALRPVVAQAGFLPLETPNFEIRDARGNGRGMQVTNIARGAALAKTLGNAPVALMRGHGNVVVGSSVKQATVYAVYADINARMQAASLALNTAIVVMNEPELFDPSEFDINRPWEHFRQKIMTPTRARSIGRSSALCKPRRTDRSGRHLMVRVAFIVGDYPSEESTRREQVALSYSNAEVQVGIVRAPITPYFYGMTQCEMTLVAPTVIEAFHRAQKEGYQAAVPLGFLDLGLDGGRAAVDIPVIAPFECSLHLASLLGDRFGLVCYHENQFGNLSMLLNRYGMAHKVVGMEASGFDLPDIAANKDAMIENFLEVGAQADRREPRGGDHPHRHHPVPGDDGPQMAARSARAFRSWRASARRCGSRPCSPISA